MKPRFANQKRQALTRVEVLTTILVLSVLAAMLFAMLLPVYEAGRRRAEDVNCINNLKQISHAYGFWEDYHSNQRADLVLITNDGNLWVDFSAMSNVVKSPEAFHCPADANGGGKISYFVNLDLSDLYSQRPLFGDDNFAVGGSTSPPLQIYTDNTVGGTTVKSGLLEISSNTPIGWTEMRHINDGNIAFADGSVSPTSNYGLQQAFLQSGQVTNRLAIP